MTHPYQQFEGTPLWATLEKALAELEANSDSRLTTAPAHVIGFLAKALICSRIVSTDASHRGTA